MRLDKHKLTKKGSQHSQSLQKKAKQAKLDKKNKKNDNDNMSIQTEITNSALSAHDKEALRLERKKKNAVKVAVYKKLNSSITNVHGHRAV